MLARERVIAVLALLLGCTPAPPEVSDGGPTGDPEGSTGGASTGTPPGPTTTEGSATVASAEGTSGSSEGPATTLPVDGTGTTTEEPPATSGSSEGPGSSSDGGMMESSTTTGEPADCHPVLAEVLYDPESGDGGEEWIKLYNPCPVEIELDGYSLGWGGISYTDTGTADLLGAIEAGGCFLVGGPSSEAGNYFPQYSLELDLSGDLQNSGGTADGIALFLGDAASITAVTVPVDAVIYGDSNSSNLIDAENNIPNPYVGDAPEGRSIRRTALTATWVVEPSPMPNECPAL